MLKNHPLAIFYLSWAALAISLSLALSTRPAESLTRLLVVILLGLLYLFHQPLIKVFSVLKPKLRFISLASLLAALVEGCHMISTPVFSSLRVSSQTLFWQAIEFYGLDLLYTLPAYFVIFSLIWWLINRYHYSFWSYTLIMGFAQTFADGGIFFFFQSPFLLLFLPYPASNYHAVNLIPFLAVREQLQPAKDGWGKWLAFPLVIGCYLICGALIQLVGRQFGLR